MWKICWGTTFQERYSTSWQKRRIAHFLKGNSINFKSTRTPIRIEKSKMTTVKRLLVLTQGRTNRRRIMFTAAWTNCLISWQQFRNDVEMNILKQPLMVECSNHTNEIEKCSPSSFPLADGSQRLLSSLRQCYTWSVAVTSVLVVAWSLSVCLWAYLLYQGWDSAACWVWIGFCLWHVVLNTSDKCVRVQRRVIRLVNCWNCKRFSWSKKSSRVRLQ